jgi:hypothetical protein
MAVNDTLPPFRRDDLVPVLDLDRVGDDHRPVAERHLEMP